MISDKLVEENINISLSSDGKNLIFTTKDMGKGQYFKELSGTAYKSILAERSYILPLNTSEGKLSNYSITSRETIGEKGLESDILKVRIGGIDSNTSDELLLVINKKLEENLLMLLHHILKGN